MKANVEVTIHPFVVPFLVRRIGNTAATGDPDAEAAFELTTIDAETLSALCDQFRVDVFKQARKQDPKLTLQNTTEAGLRSA